MSKFEIHYWVGLAVALMYLVVRIFYLPAGIIDYLIGIVFIPLFAVLPDVDQSASKARKIFLVLAFAAITALALVQKYIFIVAISLAYILIIYNSKHRGWMHSVWFAVFVCFPFLFYDFLFAGFAFMSFLSHVLLDRTTKNNKFPY